MAFPNISTPVTLSDDIESGAIRTEFEGAYEQTRERQSRYRRTISARYVLNETEKDDLLSHYKSVRESQSFSWTHPKTGESLTVRYAEPIKIPYDGAWCQIFKIDVKLREV